MFIYNVICYIMFIYNVIYIILCLYIMQYMILCHDALVTMPGCDLLSVL